MGKKKKKKKKKKKTASSLCIADFIRTFWLKDVKRLANYNPYMGAFQIGVGIEFLGALLDVSCPLSSSGHSREHFEKAINDLSDLQIYASLLNTPHLSSTARRIRNIRNDAHNLMLSGDITSTAEQSIIHLLPNTQPTSSGTVFDLYAELRCGLLHCGVPSLNLKLVSRMKQPFHQEVLNGIVYLDVKALYANFAKACEDVLANTALQNRLTAPFFKITPIEDLTFTTPSNNASSYRPNQNPNYPSNPSSCQNVNGSTSPFIRGTAVSGHQ